MNILESCKEKPHAHGPLNLLMRFYFKKRNNLKTISTIAVRLSDLFLCFLASLKVETILSFGGRLHLMQ